MSEQLTELGKAFESFKSYNSSQVSKTEATLREEIRKSAEATLAEYDVLKKQHDATKSAIDALSTQINRVGNTQFDIANPEVKKNLGYFNNSRKSAWLGKAYGADRATPATIEQAEEYAAAYDFVVRYGEKNLTAEQTKALAVGSEPDGGAWIAPPVQAGYIVKRVFETTPMRQVANVVSLNGHSYQIPMDPNRMPTGGWVSEMQPRTVTATPSLAIKEIVPGEIFAQPPVTQIMLEDAGFDVEGYLSDKSSEAFSLDENTAFVSGSGVGKPRGFLTYPTGSNTDGTNKWGEIQQVGTGSSGNYTYLGLLNIITSFRSDKYYSNLKWMIKRGNIVPLITLTNPAGQYIFQPILNGQFNSTPLLGYEIVYANDMPAIAAGAIGAALANWKMAYTIVDRVGISTLRDPYTAKPFILYYMRKRVGGDIVDYDAIKLLKLT